MKVKNIIKLFENYNPEDEIFLCYWDIEFIQGIVECDKEHAQKILDKLEEVDINFEDVIFAILELGKGL